MPRVLRTALLFFIVVLVPWGAVAAERSIVVVGDSLSAAYGLPQERGWVALLGERIKRERLDYSVVNASISGDTTGGGLSRIDRLLVQHKPAVVVLELGGNDGLRGLPIADMRKNLAAMVERSRKAGAKVVLVGVYIPPNYGPDYTKGFFDSFGELAKRYKTALVPYIMEDFALKPEFFQADRIHPTVEAQPLMMEQVWKALRPLLK